MINARHLRMAARFAAHRLKELHPFEVQALLLNACNLRCVYCRCPDIRTRTLSTEQWLTTLRRLGELGCLRIKFQGGEPTLRRDFPELCEAARDAGILAAVVTNGQRIAEKPELLDGLDECVVSIDAVDARIHDELRGQGTHERAVRAVEEAAARGVRTYVVMVVSRDTLPQLEAMLEFCEARGVGFHAQPITFGLHYTDEEARPFALTDEQARELHRRLAEWKRQGRSLMFSPAAYSKALEWPEPLGVLTKRSDGPSPCMAGSFYVHIEANGDVWPCQQHGASFTPKNIAEDGVDAALRHTQVHDCGDCWVAYLNERKQLFGMRPSAVWEMVRRA